MINVPYRIQETQMFMSTKRVLLKKGIIFKSIYFFLRGIFKNTEFKKNKEFCVKTPSLEQGIFECTEVF